mgnify:CR=1 FL=1
MGGGKPDSRNVKSPEEQGPSLSIIECGLLPVTSEQAGILQHVEDPAHVPLQDEIIDTVTTYAEQKLKDLAKKARKKYDKEWKEKNKEKLKELTKKYKEKNKAKLKELTEEYKKKNKEKLKAYQKDLRKKLKQHKRYSKLKEKKDWLSK